MANERAVIDALAGSGWWIGYCRDGAQAGSFVLAWPLGDGLWDLVFSLDVPFDGTTGEDVYLVSGEDVSAVNELVRADIERAPSREIAERAVVDLFPDTRAALAVRRAGKRRRPRRREVDRPRPDVISSDPWANWVPPVAAEVSGAEVAQ